MLHLLLYGTVDISLLIDLHLLMLFFLSLENGHITEAIWNRALGALFVGGGFGGTPEWLRGVLRRNKRRG